MAMKECFRNLQPVQIYIVLFFTVIFVVIEIIAEYFTHSLTLLINAYHMVCNIIALIGCITSIKYGNQVKSRSRQEFIEDENSTPTPASNQSNSDKRMKNTFGWARIDIMTLLVCCVFLASLSFSLVVQAAKTLIHISHLDAMHYPIQVMTIGFIGILLNIFCYFIIGGYTFNQAFFLHITTEGDVVLDKNTTSTTEAGDKQLSASTRRSPIAMPRRQGFRDIFRDVIGCIFIVITSIIVYLTDANVAKFVDPILAIISAFVLFYLSYPHLRESCMILLQTIPNHIDINLLKIELTGAFPGIVNVHDFHVWHLAGSKVISTVHIIFFDKMVYAATIQQVSDFFVEKGITHVTIQPEFHHTNPGEDDCLIRCRDNKCIQSQCCNGEETLNGVITDQLHLIINRKSLSKEIIPAFSDVGLQKFTQLDGDNTIKNTDELTMKDINCAITVHEKKCDESTVEDLNNCKKNNDEQMVGDETPCSTMAF